MNREEKVSVIKLLTDLNLPLVRMAVEKIAPKNAGAPGSKYRRVPKEKWKDKVITNRPAETFHDCNVGIQCGHQLPDGRYLCILDVDLKKQDGRDMWDGIIAQYGDPDFWAGPRSRTESGGIHLWFASKTPRNVALGLFPGIDFLGLGALSFEPPSRFIENGTMCPEYKWEIAPLSCSEIPDLPRWVETELSIREMKAKTIKENKERSDAEYSTKLCPQSAPFIAETLSRFTPEKLEYNLWLQIGMALHDASDGDETFLDLFDSWGSRVAAETGGDYDEKKTQITWSSFGTRTNRITFATFVRKVVENALVVELLNDCIGECKSLFSTVTPSGDSGVTSENFSNAEVVEKGKTCEHLDMVPLQNAVLVALNHPLIQTNLTNGATEITFQGEEMRRMDQPTEDRIILTCLDFGKSKKIKPLTKESFVMRAINLIADKNKYHPVKEYLKTCLDEYRRRRSADSVLYQMQGYSYPPERMYREKLFAGINLVKGEDEEWFRTAMDYWLRGAICKAFYGYQNPMLVVKGRQGIGKSTLARALVKRIGTSYYYAGAIDPSDKDHKIKLAQLFLWEPDELGGTTFNADTNKLKSLLTLTRVNERPPYGRYVVDMDVVCSFLGTVNDDSFLRDMTGNRRFLVANFEPVNPVDTINFLRGVEFDPNLLWGEVFDEVERKNEKAPMLSMEDNEQAEVRSEEVRVKSDLEIALEDLLMIQDGEPPKDQEWLLHRRELRAALEMYGISIGKNIMQRASEIITKMTKAKAPAFVMVSKNGERYFRKVKLRPMIISPTVNKG